MSEGRRANALTSNRGNLDQRWRQQARSRLHRSPYPVGIIEKTHTVCIVMQSRSKPSRIQEKIQTVRYKDINKFVELIPSQRKKQKKRQDLKKILEPFRAGYTQTLSFPLLAPPPSSYFIRGRRHEED